MRLLILIIIALPMFFVLPAFATDISDLASCSELVFKEISRKGKWLSAEPSEECPTQFRVEKRKAELFVTTWIIEQRKSGWTRKAFTSAKSESEFKSMWEFADAGMDIKSRATRLGACLKSIKNNRSHECLTHESKAHIVGEVSGTEHKQRIWLDDSGRHTIVEFASGDVSSPPSSPTDLFEGENILPGVKIDWFKDIVIPPSPGVLKENW